MTSAGQPHQINYRSYVVINAVGYLGIVVHAGLTVLFFYLGVHVLAALNIVSTALWAAGWQANRSCRHEGAIMLMISEVIAHTVLVVPVVGWHAGFQYYLFGAIPFSLFNNRFRGDTIIILSVCLCLTFIALDMLSHDSPPLTALTASAVRALNYANIIIAFTAVGIISYYFRLASVTLEKELEQLAHTDSLTGLYNRRKMQEVLEIQQALASRTGLNFALIFVDIDHFKKFNDSHGHYCGDYVLCQVASFLKKNLRQGDALARWGGEEFLIMLPNTKLEGARVIAEKIRKGIAERRFHLAGHDFSVTLTLGLSEHDDSASLEESLKRADDALYKGKEAGRNLVMGP